MRQSCRAILTVEENCVHSELLHSGHVSPCSDSAALGLSFEGVLTPWAAELVEGAFPDSPHAGVFCQNICSAPAGCASLLSHSSICRFVAALATWSLNWFCAAALAERRDLPRWMNLMDLILVATPFPHCRKLRMLHQPEQTMTLTAATALGVTLFFLLYLGLLMVFFTAGRLCWLPKV